MGALARALCTIAHDWSCLGSVYFAHLLRHPCLVYQSHLTRAADDPKLLESRDLSLTLHFSASNMSAPKFWLRCERKEFEERAALTPTTAKKLIDAGFEIYVERDQQRIFDDSEYEK